MWRSIGLLSGICMTASGSYLHGRHEGYERGLADGVNVGRAAGVDEEREKWIERTDLPAALCPSFTVDKTEIRRFTCPAHACEIVMRCDPGISWPQAKE